MKRSKEEIGEYRKDVRGVSGDILDSLLSSCPEAKLIIDIIYVPLFIVIDIGFVIVDEISEPFIKYYLRKHPEKIKNNDSSVYIFH